MTKEFPIAHVFPYTRSAFLNANEFGKEHADEVKKKAYHGTTFTIELSNGETHVFMSNTTYTKYWAIGRTYYLDGVLCHSGYPAGTGRRWDAIRGAISTAMSAISNVITTVWNSISSFITTMRPASISVPRRGGKYRGLHVKEFQNKVLRKMRKED